MATPNRGGWKTCPRDHKYRGADPCPVCWPGGRDKVKKHWGTGASRGAFLGSLQQLQKHRD